MFNITFFIAVLRPSYIPRPPSGQSETACIGRPGWGFPGVFSLKILLMQHEVLSEILFAHDRVGGQLLGIALKEDAALEEKVSAVGDVERLVDIVVGDEDTDVAVFQFPDNLLDVAHGNRVDAGERLVEHDELRADGQTAGNLRPSALTSRQLVALVLAHLLEAELGDEALQLLELLLAAEGRHFEHGHDIVLDAHLAEHAVLLGEIADAGPRPLVDGKVRNLKVVDIDMAVVGHDEARRHVERSGLSGSVRTEQSDYLALTDIDGDVVDHGALAVSFDQSFGTENHVVSGLRPGGRLGIGDILIIVHHLLIYSAKIAQSAIRTKQIIRFLSRPRGYLVQK